MSAFEAPPGAHPPIEGNSPEQGLRIVSFDGGGPGSYSQMIMLKEFVTRLEWDNRRKGGTHNDEELDFDEDTLCPADYFDVMGGVGFGAFCALILGRLRLSFERAAQELTTLAHAIFLNTPSEILTPEASSDRLKDALEAMLQRNGFLIGMPLKGNISRNRICKVVIFIQSPPTPGSCTPFRTYRARSQSPKCTFVEAACAALSELPHFSPVAIGPARRETLYAGTPFGFNNPTRKVLNETLTLFGEQKPVSLVLSLGAGKPSTSSINLCASFDGNDVTLLTRIAMDSERVDDELSLQLSEVDLYLRMDVDRGLEDLKTSDWHQLGAIGAHTQSYLGNGSITTSIDKALSSLRANDHLTLAQLNGAACQAVSRVPIEQKLNGIERDVKSMRDVVMQGIEKITIIDAIGNRIPIPLNFCATYEMLQDMIKFYFKHQNAPGRSFANRGEYKLVYGEDRKMVKAGEWTYRQVPNLTLEMSVVVRKEGEYKVQCPKCNVEFCGKGQNGWAICSNRQCRLRYQYQAKPYKIRPRSNRKESNYQLRLEKGNESSMSQVETEEKVDEFRLVSVVHQNEYDHRDYYRDDWWEERRDVNQQMNVPEDELSE